MKRVLVTGGYNIGKAGVATIVYRWGQNFDNNCIVYDYLMARGFPDREYVENIRQKGGDILAPKKTLHGIEKISWMQSVMKAGKFETIHINIDVAYKAFVFIILAKNAGIHNIVLHSHCAYVDDNNNLLRYVKTILHYVTRGYCIKNSKHLLACSKEAAEWMFGKKIVSKGGYIKIFNGLDLNVYKYDERLRKKYRTELGISQKEYVLCNVGRFSYQKNHKMLVDIFEQYLKVNGNSKLALIGNGELLDDVKKYVSSKNLETKVLFLGQRNDVAGLLSAMDIFVMPSRFEGLPLVLVEAQIAKLPCAIADTVSKESKISEYAEFISLDDIDSWINIINKYKGVNRSKLEIKNVEQYSINDSARILQKILSE